MPMMPIPPPGGPQINQGMVRQPSLPIPAGGPRGPPIKNSDQAMQEAMDRRHMSVNKTVSRLGEPATAEASPMKTSSWNDPLTVVVRSGVLISCMLSTFLIPRSLRFIWLLILALLIVGSIGLEIFHAWSDTSDTEEDSNMALYVLYATTAFYAAVLCALLGFLTIKLINIAQEAKTKDRSENGGFSKKLGHMQPPPASSSEMMD
jgi:hypothetical protein